MEIEASKCDENKPGKLSMKEETDSSLSSQDGLFNLDYDLKEYRTKNFGKIILATLNVNSLRYKFDEIKSLVSGKIDIFVINETKLDSSFPTEQFHIPGFSLPYRMDRDRNGGGTMIYVREDIPSKELTRHTFKEDIEGIFIELNFKKYKILVLGTYRPPNSDKLEYFDSISKSLDLYLTKYEKFVLLGDFNVNVNNTDPIFTEFIEKYGAKNIVKNPTCFKSLENPSIIDLIITNNSKSFWNTKTMRNSISDFHALVLTVLNIKYVKPNPIKITYRKYKHFDSESFQSDLLGQFSQGCEDYSTFEKLFMTVLNRHAPLKTKMIRGNHAPFMNKQVRKSIMKRNQLYTKWTKSGKEEDKTSFKRQKILVRKQVKNAKKEFYQNLSNTDLLDNKKFWKLIKSSFTDKVILKQKINLMKEGEIISDDDSIANIFNDFFSQVVKNLEIKENIDILNHNNVNNEASHIEHIVNKFKYHPSIIEIKQHVGNVNKFNFKKVSRENVLKELKAISAKKATTKGNIPCKSLRDNATVCADILTNIINKDILNSTFPDKLKTADVTPIYKGKKTDPTDKKNYRPVSVLPSTSKVYERLMQSQITEYISGKLSPYLCGYRKGYSAQHALISLIEHWRKALDKKGYAGAILMDLSKAFDCINHDLLIAKLEAYGFGLPALNFIKSYLTNRSQRIKINNTFSSWSDLLTGIPQGSVLGPLLFNIYLNDLFWTQKYSEVCNLADDTTYYSSDLELKELIRKLEHDSALALEWFDCNYMKLNTDKCHLLVAGQKNEHIFAKIGKDLLWESKTECLLGVTIDNQLRFKEHISKLCKVANNKVTALIRYCNILNFEKRRSLMKAFIESQFSFSPLTWMFHDRKINNMINRVHERALRCVYRNDTSTFKELLIKDGSFTIHHRNIQTMAIEMFKLKMGMGPSLLDNIFNLNSTRKYHLRGNTDFLVPSVNTVHFGKDSLQYFGSVIWKLVPSNILACSELKEFKNKIRNWLPSDCPCRLCETYIHNLGYTNITD